MTQLGIELGRQKGSINAKFEPHYHCAIRRYYRSLDWSYIEVKSDIHTFMNKNTVFQASLFSMLYI